MGGKAQKSYGARSELDSLLGLEKVDQWNPIRTSAIQSRSRPMRFLGFYSHENGAPRLLLKLAANVFKKWVERCEKCNACQGRCFEEGSNKVSPGTF
jgi:hypothetical protein